MSVQATRLYVHVYLCGDSCWSGQMVRLYGAAVTGIRSPGQMGRDAFAPEVAE